MKLEVIYAIISAITFFVIALLLMKMTVFLYKKLCAILGYEIEYMSILVSILLLIIFLTIIISHI